MKEKVAFLGLVPNWLRIGIRSASGWLGMGSEWPPIDTVWLPIGFAPADLEMKLALDWAGIDIGLAQDWHDYIEDLFLG